MCHNRQSSIGKKILFFLFFASSPKGWKRKKRIFHPEGISSAISSLPDPVRRALGTRKKIVELIP
jgi:hypothetical protein